MSIKGEIFFKKDFLPFGVLHFFVTFLAKSKKIVIFCLLAQVLLGEQSATEVKDNIATEVTETYYLITTENVFIRGFSRIIFFDADFAE